MTVKIVKFGAFYVGVGVTGSKFAYRFFYFWFRSLSWKGWVLNRYESEKMWKKLWHRLHSQPVFRSLASPATPLVLRPRHAFTQALLFYILRAARGTHVSVHS